MQDEAEREAGTEGTDFCVFSSWLGPLVEDKVAVRAVGSFEGNVLVAVSQRKHTSSE